jgi:hypothetical protein
MGYSSLVSLNLLQTLASQDTIVARMISERGVLDWTNGILQFVVLVLGVATLVTMVVLLVTVRRGVLELNTLIKQFAADTRPLIASASAVATDAREVVAMLRTDAERVTDAASLVSEQLIEAAEATAQRVDDVNAVLDVLQAELEDTAIAAAAVVRGVRIGASTLTTSPRRRPRNDPPDTR